MRQQLTTQSTEARWLLFLVIVVLVCATLISPVYSASPLTLEEAVALGQGRDLQAQMIRQQMEAKKANAVQVGTLPDPKLQFGLINVPTDSFDFDQEDMTQVKIGLSQQFPPGNTLKFKRQASELSTRQSSISYQLRLLQAQKNIVDIWFELVYLDGKTLLLTRYKQVLQQLKHVVESSYSIGRSKQYDLIQLDIMNDEMNDRLMNAAQDKQKHLGQLSLWLGQEAYSALKLSFPDGTFVREAGFDQETVLQQVATHPEAQLKKVQIDEAVANVKVVEEGYKPEWSVDMAYGYREDGGHEVDRSDFFSVMASVSLPIRSSDVQDQKVVSQLAHKNAAQFEWQDVLQSLAARLKSAYAQVELLQQRRQGYQQRLIPLAEQQAQAALSAYQASSADFSDVVDAELKFIDVHIDSIRIDMNLHKALNVLDYLDARNPYLK